MTYAAQIQVDGTWFEIGVYASLDEARAAACSPCWDHLASGHRIVDENDSIFS